MIYDTYLLRRGKKIIKQEYSGQLTWGRGVECTTVEGVGFITGRRSMVQFRSCMDMWTWDMSGYLSDINEQFFQIRTFLSGRLVFQWRAAELIRGSWATKIRPKCVRTVNKAVLVSRHFVKQQAIALIITVFLCFTGGIFLDFLFYCISLSGFLCDIYESKENCDQCFGSGFK